MSRAPGEYIPLHPAGAAALAAQQATSITPPNAVIPNLTYHPPAIPPFPSPPSFAATETIILGSAPLPVTIFNGYNYEQWRSSLCIVLLHHGVYDTFGFSEYTNKKLVRTEYGREVRMKAVGLMLASLGKDVRGAAGLDAFEKVEEWVEDPRRLFRRIAQLARYWGGWETT